MEGVVVGKERVLLGEGALGMKIVGNGEAEMQQPQVMTDFRLDPYLLSFLLNSGFALLSILATRACNAAVHSQWTTPAGQAMRANVQKTALFSLLFSSVVLVAYLLLPSASGSDKASCSSPTFHWWMLGCLATVIFTSSCLRYMAHSLQHTNEICGYVIYSPPPIQQLGTMFTSNFSRVVALSLGLYMLLVFGMTVLASYASALFQFDLCALPAANSSDTWEEKAMLIAQTAALFLLPVAVVLIMENAVFFSYRQMKTKYFALYLVISSPFVTTLLITVWPSWLVTMSLTAWLFNNFFRLQCAVWLLVSPMDTFAMLCILFSANHMHRRV
jgi:hypothetical protein